MIGKIEKLNEWASGKGYFFEIAGETFVGNGKPNIVVGDEITFEKDKPFGNDGTKFFAKKIRKLGEVGQIEEYFEPKPRQIQLDRGKAIQRLAIMKMATRIICAKINSGLISLGNPADIAEEIKKQTNEIEKVL